MTGTLLRWREFWLWGVVLAVAILVFLISPGAAPDKSRAVLHGLCAQTPSHSFGFGGTLLPFDSRMSGIYGGAIATIFSLIGSRRVLFYGNPPWRVVAVLVAGAGLMAIDGFNSLLTDLQLWHPYESRNLLRLVTGYLMGMALGVALCWLLGSSMWRMSRSEAGVNRLRVLLLPTALLIPYLAVLMSGWSGFLVPLTYLLMFAAWMTLTMLMLVVVLLIFRYEDQVSSIAQLHIPGVVASGLAMFVMLGLAGGRYWLEQTMGLPGLV